MWYNAFNKKTEEGDKKDTNKEGENTQETQEKDQFQRNYKDSQTEKPAQQRHERDFLSFSTKPQQTSQNQNQSTTQTQSTENDKNYSKEFSKKLEEALRSLEKDVEKETKPQEPLHIEVQEEPQPKHQNTLSDDLDKALDAFATVPDTREVKKEEPIIQDKLKEAPTKEENPRLKVLKHTLEETSKHIQKALQIISEEIGDTSRPIREPKIEEVSTLVPGMGVQTTNQLEMDRAILEPGNHQEKPGNIIEGLFDGQNMIGSDNKQYSVPANYASKSKLVEGDVMKLTISERGTFMYKQIGPIPRKRVIGVLGQDMENRNYHVSFEGRTYRILTASVTYFKGVPGDEVVMLIPREENAKWGAVENIIKKL